LWDAGTPGAQYDEQQQQDLMAQLVEAAGGGAVQLSDLKQYTWGPPSLFKKLEGLCGRAVDWEAVAGVQGLEQQQALDKVAGLLNGAARYQVDCRMQVRPGPPGTTVVLFEAAAGPAPAVAQPHEKQWNGAMKKQLRRPAAVVMEEGATITVGPDEEDVHCTAGILLPTKVLHLGNLDYIAEESTPAVTTVLCKQTNSASCLMKAAAASFGLAAIRCWPQGHMLLTGDDVEPPAAAAGAGVAGGGGRAAAAAGSGVAGGGGRAAAAAAAAAAAWAPARTLRMSRPQFLAEYQQILQQALPAVLGPNGREEVAVLAAATSKAQESNMRVGSTAQQWVERSMKVALLEAR
jgi:hypothetical protein